mmetsp:Transcript_17846/g.52847  ORF Transcript_17846/g.52847 Transcript_17846/m.52847 type:complete len:95 (-) Transcript_17846:185-469(-)
MFREHGDTMMEPCGHLALCGACNKNGNRNRGDATCVLCRTPGRALHFPSSRWSDASRVSEPFFFGRKFWGVLACRCWWMVRGCDGRLLSALVLI